MAVYIVKVILITALLTIQILLGNTWLAVIWGFLLALNATLLVIYSIEAIEAIEPTDNYEFPDEERYYRCSHCGTITGTYRGVCKQCGAPL